MHLTWPHVGSNTTDMIHPPRPSVPSQCPSIPHGTTVHHPSVLLCGRLIYPSLQSIFSNSGLSSRKFVLPILFLFFRLAQLFLVLPFSHLYHFSSRPAQVQYSNQTPNNRQP